MRSADGTADVALMAFVTCDLIDYISYETEVIFGDIEHSGWLQLVGLLFLGFNIWGIVVDLCVIRTGSPFFLKMVLIL